MENTRNGQLQDKGRESFTINQLWLHFVLGQTGCPALSWLSETFCGTPWVQLLILVPISQACVSSSVSHK